ncbi:MAG: phenylalanine--tRNA ligase subunit beta [endosymbiont of Galathealinum brachiosum]|uniref:Phenylalanine--tRNA ligase beta subunit n=1 Tax=endosymbiont of Galathealinum brachiosum TaxID=2200906 RepID=A0A370DK42_9GAMM|nr:MAG: phenylalanine--tRNA ligase subunit beta [endosymbiont of Galathealinum brachiosum]
MKISQNWLHEWVNPQTDLEEFCATITMAGLEVDSIEPAAGEFTNIVVARVTSVEKHPDADKLNICKVDAGSEELQIVCGASNVREGLVVACATIGAVLPGDFKIKKSKLRGVESFGMLCSEKEMGLADQADGLMELPDDAPIGTDIREYLQLNDTVIEVDLTPNRADCLSVAGVAREVATLYKSEINEVDVSKVAVDIDDTFAVNVSATQACPRYTGRVVRDVNTQAITPLWMVEKLRRAGIRSLGPCVDVTNFVMLELGQPMHAFDLDVLKGSIQVRMANIGEKVTLLDGKEIEATENTLLITDENQALALAGIMGGEKSGVTDSTRNVFLESAHFNPLAIAGKAREYGMHTDSSHRFERGVDPELPIIALERATQLLIDICGGQAGPVVDQSCEADLPAREAIQLRLDRINRMLGIEFDAAEVESILNRLGMQLEKNADGWMVTAPSFRFDIAIEADLIEEIIRIHGYNNIPRKLPTYQPAMKPLVEAEIKLQRVKDVLVERGYYEAISYSFVDPKWQAAIDPDLAPVKLANPISSDLSVMRTSIWPGLLKAVSHNLNRQQPRVRLFETGLTFVKQGDDLIQNAKISGAITGTIVSEQWSAEERKIDFFDAKSDVEAILSMGGLNEVLFEKAQHSALHPGQSAQIFKKNKAIGWIGALHPNTQKTLDIDPIVYVFEVDQESLLEGSVPAFEPLSKFPEVRRDLAVLVKQEIAVEDLVKSIKSVTSEIFQEILLFDVYTGTNIEDGLKSVALGLILQGFSSTLTEEDVEKEINQIITVLNDKYGATLRE